MRPGTASATAYIFGHSKTGTTTCVVSMRSAGRQWFFNGVEEVADK
jgi:hypothetical protein